MRIGSRVAVVHASVVAAFAAAASWAFLVSAERALDGEMSARTRTAARMAAQRVDPAWLAGLENGDVPVQTLCDATLAETAGALTGEGHGRIVVLDGKGGVLCASDPRIPHGTRYAGLAVDAFEAGKARAGAAAVSLPYPDETGAWFQSAYEPLGGDAVLGAELEVRYRAPLARLRRAVTFFAVLSAAAAAVVGALLARGITRPLARLARAMVRVGPDGLPDAAGVRGHDEVGQLGERFDALVDALKRHDLELRELSATVAHEVRNPLGAMTGYAELLARRAPDAETTRLTDGIREEVAALERLVGRFLRFAGDVRASHAPLAIASVLDDALRAALPPDSGTTVERRYDAVADVPGDADLLREVFVNLLRNASQATRDRGRIAVTVSSSGDRHVVVTVRDDGPGIAPEIRERLFQPFQTTKADGTGLGLAICRRIVSAHGGTIECESGSSGTAFVVRLPVAETTPKRAASS